MRGIGALSSGPSVAPIPVWEARPWSVLYMRTQGIGDLILATGVLRAIADSHPTIALDVLTTPAAAPVLERNPHVRRTHVTGRSVAARASLLGELRRERYDVVIDGKITRGASFIRSPALAMALRAPCRIGVGGGNHRFVYNVCVPPYDRTQSHMVDGSATLAAPFGVDLSQADLRPQIFLSAAECHAGHARWIAAARERSASGDRWLVNLSAGAPIRRWPDERWIALIRHLRSSSPGAVIGVMGARSESVSVQRVAREGGATAFATPALRDALALVATSDRVVTSDTSVTHAASAFSIPTVLFLQRGLEQWGSWRTRCELAQWTGSSVSALSFEAARDALDRLLAAR
jgi:ADP-heptose:LPS heptosyltransferase